MALQGGSRDGEADHSQLPPLWEGSRVLARKSPKSADQSRLAFNSNYLPVAYNLLADIRPFGDNPVGEEAVQGDVHAIRIAGLSQESPCLIGVTISGIGPATGSAGLAGRSGEGSPFVLEVVAPGREVVNERESEALVEDIVDPVPVDSQVHCMANPGVAYRGFLGGRHPWGRTRGSDPEAAKRQQRRRRRCRWIRRQSRKTGL